MVHVAPDTTSTIVSKSISKDGGRTTYRGLVQVEHGRARARRATCAATRCSSTRSRRSDTYPYIEIEEEDVRRSATRRRCRKVGDEQLFYLMSRGLTEEEAMAMIVQRLHRADRQGAADGVRRRAEPADRAADGGLVG